MACYPPGAEVPVVDYRGRGEEDGSAMAVQLGQGWWHQNPLLGSRGLRPASTPAPWWWSRFLWRGGISVHDPGARGTLQSLRA